MKKTTLANLTAGLLQRSAEMVKEIERLNNVTMETESTEMDATEDVKSRETGTVSLRREKPPNVPRSQKNVEMVSSMKAKLAMMETESTETDAEETAKSREDGGVTKTRPEPLNAIKSLLPVEMVFICLLYTSPSPRDRG